MKIKYLFYLYFVLISYITSAQIWSTPIPVIDPNSGSGGFSGNFSNLIVLSNGNPAMADNPGGAYGSGGYVRYLHASDPSGAGPWETVIVDAATGTHPDTFQGQVLRRRLRERGQLPEPARRQCEYQCEVPRPIFHNARLK